VHASVPNQSAGVRGAARPPPARIHPSPTASSILPPGHVRVNPRRCTGRTGARTARVIDTPDGRECPPAGNGPHEEAPAVSGPPGFRRRARTG